MFELQHFMIFRTQLDVTLKPKPEKRKKDNPQIILCNSDFGLVFVLL